MQAGERTVPDPDFNGSGPPTVTIYTARIASDNRSPGTIARVISHEIGHCVNLGHCGVAIPMDSLCIMHPYYDKDRAQFGVHHNPDYDLIHPHNAPLIDQDIRPEETSTTIISTNTGPSSYGCDHNSQYDYCTDTGNCGQPTDSHTNGLCGHRWCICAAAAPSESTNPTDTTSPTYHVCGVHQSWQSGDHAAAGCGQSGHFVCDSLSHVQEQCTQTNTNGDRCTYMFWRCVHPTVPSYGPSHTHQYPAPSP